MERKKMDWKGDLNEYYDEEEGRDTWVERGERIWEGGC